MTADAYIRRSGEAELRWMGTTATSFLAEGEDTGGASRRRAARRGGGGPDIARLSREYGIEFVGPPPEVSVDE